MAAIGIVRHRIVDYSVSGDNVYLDTIDRVLSRHQIAYVLARMTLASPDEISKLGGTSHIYTILADRRIAGR